MAQTSRFSASGNTIEIKCHDSEEIFNIHEELLKKILSPKIFEDYFKLERSSFGVAVTLPHKSFEHFVHWLYRNRVYDPCQDETREYRTLADIQELINAYEVGRELQCCDFQDAVIDAIAQECFSREVRINLGDFINAFVDAFSYISHGRQLAIDFLTYGSYCDEQGLPISNPFNALQDVEGACFLADLAYGALKGNGIDVVEDGDWEGFAVRKVNLIIATGFIAAKAGGLDMKEAEEMPWDDDPCQYHCHGHRRPCYKDK